MSLEIRYDHNLEEKIEAFGHLWDVFFEARRSGLSSVGFFLMGAVRDHIESFPDSNHPLTKLYRKKFGADKRFTRRGFFSRADSPFEFLGKFARYRVNRRATQVDLGFGKSSKGQPGKFDRNLQKIGARVQSGDVIPVSPKMRRKIAAGTRGNFALRSTTSDLRVEPRPIDKPVFLSKQAEIPPLFAEKFCKALDKRYRKL